MRVATSIIAALILGAAAAAAADSAGPRFWQTPAVEGAGRIHPLPHAAYQPSRDEMYKVVFPVTKGAASPTGVNPSLDHVARTVNLYVSAGVPLSHLKFVVILYGAATGDVLDNQHFRDKFGTDNPNIAVIVQLHKAGVRIAVCGQALAEQGYRREWIAPHVTLALSALTTIIGLERRGYALMPL